MANRPVVASSKDDAPHFPKWWEREKPAPPKPTAQDFRRTFITFRAKIPCPNCGTQGSLNLNGGLRMKCVACGSNLRSSKAKTLLTDNQWMQKFRLQFPDGIPPPPPSAAPDPEEARRRADEDAQLSAAFEAFREEAICPNCQTPGRLIFSGRPRLKCKQCNYNYNRHQVRELLEFGGFLNRPPPEAQPRPRGSRA